MTSVRDSTGWTLFDYLSGLSVFLLAVAASALAGTLMATLMYVTVNGLVRRQNRYFPAYSDIEHGMSAQHLSSARCRTRTLQSNPDNHDYDDYGTFGRRLKVIGTFTGSMASLQDAEPQDGIPIPKREAPSPWSPSACSLSLSSIPSPPLTSSPFDLTHQTQPCYSNRPESAVPGLQLPPSAVLSHCSYERDNTEESETIFSESLYLG